MNGPAARAISRVARREITRHRGRSLLVALLILLPVAAMVGAISIYRTTQPTQEQEIVVRMGRADLIATGASEAQLRAHLPRDSRIEPIAFDETAIVLPGAKPTASLRALDLAGLAQGMLTLVDGRLPAGAGEVAITSSVATLAGVALGGQLTLDGSPPRTVVGVIENPLLLSERVVLVDPASLPLRSEEFGTWLIGLPEGADPEAVVNATYDPETGGNSANLQSRLSGQLGDAGGSASSTILVLGALALVEAALVASAAFAVSIRRRQRELGLLAATGATPGQLAGTVIAEAAILGIVASLAGIAIGLGGALAVTPWLDQLTERRNPPLVVDWVGLIGPATIGFVAAMIAAIIPARTAATVPVLLSLSGRRPPVAPARRTLRLGLAAVGVSIGMTFVGANLSLQRAEFSILLMIGGAVLGTLGFGACGPWLLERLEGLAARMPLAGRIAFRDTARARSRSSPIVTAVLASFAATVALGTWTVSRDAENAADWQPWLHADEIIFQGAGAIDAGKELAKSDGALGGSAIMDLVVPEAGWFWIETPGARDANGNLISWGGGEVYLPPQVQDVSLATPDLLAVAHAESAASALEAGKVVLLWHEPMTADVVEIVIQEDPEAPEPTRRERVDAHVIVTGIQPGALPAAILPPSVADHLGLEPGRADEFVVRFDHPITEADLSAASAVAGRFPDTFANVSLGPERPGEGFRMLMILAALVFAVSVTGIAIALGEAESRPEQRSLLALGADPRLRRRIAAARAAVLGLLAGILAVPAGLLPVWGLLASRDAALVVPALELVGSVAALPILAVAGAWLFTRPIPEWGAFRSIGTTQ